MSSTNVHSKKDQKVAYGIVLCGRYKSLVMPPEKANEARKEQDPKYKIEFQAGGSYYTDKEGTKVTQNGQVLTRISANCKENIK